MWNINVACLTFAQIRNVYIEAIVSWNAACLPPPLFTSSFYFANKFVLLVSVTGNWWHMWLRPHHMTLWTGEHRRKLFRMADGKLIVLVDRPWHNQWRFNHLFGLLGARVRSFLWEHYPPGGGVMCWPGIETMIRSETVNSCTLGSSVGQHWWSFNSFKMQIHSANRTGPTQRTLFMHDCTANASLRFIFYANVYWRELNFVNMSSLGFLPFPHRLLAVFKTRQKWIFYHRKVNTKKKPETMKRKREREAK